eukprot:2048241-Pleurochrysis_carterae.AAC.1
MRRTRGLCVHSRADAGLQAAALGRASGGGGVHRLLPCKAAGRQRTLPTLDPETHISYLSLLMLPFSNAAMSLATARPCSGRRAPRHQA